MLKKWCTKTRKQFDVTHNPFRTDVKMTADYGKNINANNTKQYTVILLFIFCFCRLFFINSV